MLSFRKRLATIIFLTLFSAATIVSCGKQSNAEEGNTEEQAAGDSTEHPAESNEHPADSSEHPADSTQNQ
jgi:hypothetical protein